MANKKRRRRRGSKRPITKRVKETVWTGDEWKVVSGRLVPQAGRPPKTSHLFLYVAEKLPYTCLNDVRKDMKRNAENREGVYMAHDSMGTARYGGRGQIFNRLAAHKKKYPRELVYFSFYVVKDKKHERELETAILRAAGPQMILNTRKVRDSISRGSIHDYEPGTRFYERQGKRGRAKK